MVAPQEHGCTARAWLHRKSMVAPQEHGCTARAWLHRISLRGAVSQLTTLKCDAAEALQTRLLPSVSVGVSRAAARPALTPLCDAHSHRRWRSSECVRLGAETHVALMLAHAALRACDPSSRHSRRCVPRTPFAVQLRDCIFIRRCVPAPRTGWWSPAAPDVEE
jgi:hypothetical protein